MEGNVFRGDDGGDLSFDASGVVCFAFLALLEIKTPSVKPRLRQIPPVRRFELFI